EWDGGDIGPVEPGLEPSSDRDLPRGRGRMSPSSGRSREMPPPGREGSSIPEIGADPVPDDPGAERDLDEISRHDEPPRGRGGRAAIRSRGGEIPRPRETSLPQDLGLDRPARGPGIPGEYDTERRRPQLPDRPADTERRRSPGFVEPSRERERDRDRPSPH